MARHSFSSLETVNRFLETYEKEWYSFLDVFVHLSAPKLETVFEWRAEQERDLWAKKGTGRTENQVREFVARFMPAYEIYLDRLKQETVFRENHDVAQTLAEPEGRHLRLDLDEYRNLIQATLVE
jgi:D-glycerate 3-kinase